MKRTSRILFLVGGIISLVLASIFLILGVVFLIFTLPFFLDMVRSGLIESGASVQSANAAVAVWQVSYTSTFITMFILSVFGYINAALAFTARNKEGSKGLYIANIVFGLLSCAEVNVAGGILAIINKNREENRQNIIDVEAK